MSPHEVNTAISMAEKGNNREIARVLRAIVAGEVSIAPSVSAVSVSATTGLLPVVNGAVTIANAATPTAAELLEYCTELNAKIAALGA